MTSADPKSNPLLLFYHIPKTAGTSVCRAVRETVGGESKRVCLPEMQQWLDGLRAGQSDVKDVAFLCGHFGYGIDRLISRPTKAFTFLRHPLEQSLSMHFEATRRPDVYPHGPLEVLLTSSWGAPYFNNTQVRHLASDSGTPVRGPVCRTHLERAKEVVATHLTAFGILEFFESSLNLINAKLGLSMVPTRSNESKRPDLCSVPPRLLALLWDANELDLELYEYSAALFMQRLKVGVG